MYFFFPSKERRGEGKKKVKLKFETAGQDAVTQALDGFSERRVRAAVATGLTRTAVQVREADVAEMRGAFDRPTDYTLRSLFVSPAKADRLMAEVYVKDNTFSTGTPATKYLLPQVDGGQRHIKRFERALQAAGAMPSGWQSVPAQGSNSAARYDAYGNLSRGQIIQILSQVGVELTAGYNRRIAGPIDKRKGAQAKRRRALGRAGGQYVAIPSRKGKLAPGIYLATGRDFGAKVGYGRTGALRPVVLFVKATAYRRAFDFEGTSRRVAERTLVPNVQRAIEEQRQRLAAQRSGVK